jgi:hypothetical protein
MIHVLVFKTSVDSDERIALLKPALDLTAGAGNWNFALDDDDKILRIVAGKTDAEKTIRLLAENGFVCSELDD